MNSDPITDDAILPLLPEGRLRWSIHSYGTLGSTNEVAGRLADAGAPEGTLVVAERQASGRGRRGSRWHSPPGGLWFSLILHPHLPPERAGGLSVVAAVAVARAVAEVSDVEPRIKWPNDVYVGGRKLAGAMVESAARGRLVLGVGVNVNVPREELPENQWYEAASLLTETGRLFRRAELLARILQEFERRYFLYRSPEHHELTEEWRRLSLAFGEHVIVRRGGEEIEGDVFGLEDDGGIVLRLPDGRREKVLPLGDVTLGLHSLPPTS